MGPGSLFVISAPSGTGKTTVVRQLLATIPDLVHSVSYTTRAPRREERDGEDYHFVDAATFQRMVAEGAFVEWAEVHGARYGTPRVPLERWRAAGKDVILDLDVQGGRALKRAVPATVTIFLMPPSREALAKRLQGRGTESPAALTRRLQEAEREMQAQAEYAHVVVNDSVAEACRAIAALILAVRAQAAQCHR